MLNPIKKKNTNSINMEIARILEQMSHYDANSEEYATMAKNLDTLTKIGNNTDNSVSREALLAVGANLAGIGMILMHENTHALTSKALGLILKAKL